MGGTIPRKIKEKVLNLYLRPVAVMRRKETEDLGYLAFSIRLRKIMDENSLSEDHLNLQELNLVQTYLDPYKGS